MDHPAYQSQISTSPTPGTASIPEQPVKPSGRNWKKWIFIVGFIMVVLLTGTAYVLSQQQTKQSEETANQIVANPSPTPASNAAVADPTADWNTFVNKEKGFSFKYPQSFGVKDRSASLPPLNIVIMEDKNDNFGNFVNVYGSVSSQSIIEFINDPSNKLTYVKSEIIGGNNFTIAKDKVLTSRRGDRNAVYLFKNGNIIFTIWNSAYDPIEETFFNQILQTFKFKAPIESFKTSDPKTACTQNNGQWIEEHKECQSAMSSGIDEKTCNELRGVYNGCASPCRHNPNAATCIDACSKVCKF